MKPFNFNPLYLNGKLRFFCKTSRQPAEKDRQKERFNRIGVKNAFRANRPERAFSVITAILFSAALVSCGGKQRPLFQASVAGGEHTPANTEGASPSTEDSSAAGAGGSPLEGSLSSTPVNSRAKIAHPAGSTSTGTPSPPPNSSADAGPPGGQTTGPATSSTPPVAVAAMAETAETAAAPPESPPTLSFASVSGLLDTFCMRCHDPAIPIANRFGGPDINWLDHATAQSKKDVLKQRVWDYFQANNVGKTMPFMPAAFPHPDGEEITEEQRRLIADWVDSGAPP